MGRALFDRYLIVHAAWGAIMERLGISAPTAIVTHLGFEASENTIKKTAPVLWPDPTPDTLTNHTGDIASFGVGYALSKALKDNRLTTGLAILGTLIWIDGYKKATKRVKHNNL